MKVELEQASRSLEDAEAAISFGDFSQLHDLLQQTTQLLDMALGQMNDSMMRIEALHELQQSFEEPRLPSREQEIEEELAMVA
jgi:hypothetical protein